MSGFEIAGVVLGALPILCDTAKELSGVLKKAKSWWRFEATFEAFTSAIATQEVAYTQVLKRLLDPLNISDAEFDSLLRDPKSSLWHEPCIREGLRMRLSPSEHRWFMRHLSDLNETILELQKLLPLNKLYHLDSTSLESELFRLHTSFSSDKDRLLERVTNINNELHQFFDRASGVTRQPVSRKPELPLKDLHDEALTFFEALSQNWRCSCTAAHIVGVTVQPEVIKSAKGHNAGFFDVLLETENRRKKLRLHIESTKTVTPKPAGRDARIATKINIDAAGDMRDQMALKKRLESASLAATDKSVATLAFTSLSISNPPCSDSPRKSILKRVTKRLQKPWPTAGFASTPVLPRPKSSASPAASLNRSSMSSSTIVFDDSSMMSTADSESSLPSSSSSGGVSGGVSNASKVRFVGAGRVPESRPEPKVTDTGDLANICKMATNDSSTDGCRNMLSLGDGRKLILEQQQRVDDDCLKTQSINAFLQTTSMRYARLYVGLRFAITLLSVATSAWLPSRLAKDDILLVNAENPNEAAAKPSGPYFSRSSRDICSSSSAIDPKNVSLWNAKTSLLLLGVVLLELFHGDTLENQPSWAECLDEDGSPNDMTVFCSAWLWINTAQASMKAWIGEELGGDLHEAIRKCICYEFGRSNDFGDSRFVELVYREVVVPLEKCCPQF